MKIAITKKLKIDLNRKMMVLVFSFIVLALTCVLAFIGFSESNRQGKAESVKASDKDITIDKKRIETTDDYRDMGTSIDLNSGYGKPEPFK
jgi:hypothetical protein